MSKIDLKHKNFYYDVENPKYSVFPNCDIIVYFCRGYSNEEIRKRYLQKAHVLIVALDDAIDVYFSKKAPKNFTICTKYGNFPTFN